MKLRTATSRKFLTVFYFSLGALGALAAVTIIPAITSVHAATCSSVDQATNDAVYDACTWSGTRGTMWISSNSSTTDVSSRVIVDDWESGDGKVDVYLHGAILGGDGDADGTYIKLVKGGATIYGTAEGYAAYEPLTNVPDEMLRKNNSKGTAEIVSSVQTIKLNVKKMMQIEDAEGGVGHTVSGLYWVYNIPIQAFRCYVGKTPSAGNGACYSSKSTMRVEVKKVNRFQGNSQAGPSASNWSAKTDWQNTTGHKATYYINNCDPINGCSGAIRHLLKQKSGAGSTDYQITRTSNFNTVGSGTIVSTTTENFNGSGISTDDSGHKYRAVNVNTYISKLYPGQVICETIKFKPNNLSDTSINDASTTACVAALGSAQKDAFLDINVKNETVSAYGTFQKEVYAKPGDQLTYQSTYHPEVQRAYNLIPEKMQINGGTIYPTGNNANASSTLRQLFNAYSSNNWNNAFAVQQSKNNFTSHTLVSNQTYTVGSTDQKTYTSPTVTVTATDPGKSIDQKALTNANSTVKSTPYQVVFDTYCVTIHHDDADDEERCFDRANVQTTSQSAVANARVPYNFKNTTAITSAPETTILYAGESKQISYNYAINPKQNTVTTNSSDDSRKYATSVGDPRWRLEICIGDNACENNASFHVDDQTADKTPADASERSEFNVSVGQTYAGKTGDNAISKQTSINVPDVAAGTKVCLRSAVYPATSGDNKNWQDPEGDHNWAYSTPVCYIVAKKPSLEIWGGNVYTGGNISTSTSAKGPLAGQNTYHLEKSNYAKRYFGSWGELGIISSGIIKGFSSGASLGFANNNNGILSPNPFITTNTTGVGGSTKSSICNRSPLTFANSPCESNQVGAIGNTVATSNAKADKSALINKYIYGSAADLSTHVDGTFVFNDPTHKVAGTAYYYYSTSSRLEVPAATIDKNTLQIVHSTGDIYLTGDLHYSDTAASETFATLPKLVIYAENNININCSVTNIDAVLIGHIVTTCANADGSIPDVDSPDRSHQLLINGAVVADQLRATRTYGAATGANSMVPAEIINYDPTLYLWGGNDSDSSSDVSTNVDVTYQKELAPRY